MKRFAHARVPASLLPAGFPDTASPDPDQPLVACDIDVDGARIVAVSAASATLPPDAAPVEDLHGAVVLPGWADAHIHLDKTHTWDRSPNRDRTFPGAIATLFADERHWTEADVVRRANYAIACAHAHGSVALRTHFNCPAGVLRDHHDLFRSLAAEWRGRVELQYVPLCTEAGYATPVNAPYFDRALESGCAAIGGMPLMNPDLRAQIDRMMALAAERGMGLDLHIDENPDPASETLREIALGVLRNEFPHPVTCGHCCSLSRQEPARQAETIALVAEAGLHVIPLPMCNLFLMDRSVDPAGRPLTPQWRGVTLLHEFLNAGVNVAIASDNVRDAFYAYGDYDMLEVYSQAVRIGHLDGRLPESPRVVTANPATLMGLADRFGSVTPGRDARLVVFDAPSLNHLLARPSAPRRHIVGETLQRPDLPAWEDLAKR